MDLSLTYKHTVFFLSFQKKGYVTVSEIRSSLKWETERAKQVLVRTRVSRAQRVQGQRPLGWGCVSAAARGILCQLGDQRLGTH